MKNTLKKIYRQIPYKKSFFEAVKTVYSPPENIYKHLHFQDDFRVSIDESHSFLMTHYGFEVENSLFWTGITEGWEKTSLSLWIKLVKKSAIIFDIGANTGVYSLIAKSLNSNSNVFAFEPVERVFQKLEHNNQLNGYDIACYEAALSNSDGTATIYDTPTEHTYSVTVNKNMKAADADMIPTEIKICRLDTFIEQEKIEKIDLIKIDVETHEPEVLEGFGIYLPEFSPTILIEVLSNEIGEKIEEQVKDIGYLFFNLDEKTNSVRQVDKITKSDYYNYLLCSPQIAKELGLLN